MPWGNDPQPTGGWGHDAVAGQPAPPAQPKPNMASDLFRSFTGGLLSGEAALAEAVDPVRQIIRSFPGGPVAQIALKPLEQFTAQGLADRFGAAYQPKTVPGRYAKAVGEFVPMAATGGESAGARVAEKAAPRLVKAAARRAAQVVAPAVASQGAADAAKAAGAPPVVQEGARVAGAVAGGGVAGARFSPARTAKVNARTVKAPTLDELVAQKNAAYRAVDDAGVEFRPEAVTTLIRGISDDMQTGMIDAGLHPSATAVLARLRNYEGFPLSLSKLDQLRQLVRDNVAGSANRSERRLGQIMLKNMDEFIGAAGPDQVASGDPAKAAALIKRARELNTRVRKIETVQDAVGSADLRAVTTGSGGNVNNATRQKLRPLIDPANRKRMRNLTPDETAAMQRVVRGTPAQNALRQAGKLSPEGNGLMSALHLGAAWPTHGVSGLVAIGGAVAKRVADRATQQNVQRLIDLMARGGVNGATAEAEIAASEPMAFEEAVRQLRATLGEARAQQMQQMRQRLLMANAAFLAGAGSAPPSSPQERPPQ